jgi:uncharacterized membrane protein
MLSRLHRPAKEQPVSKEFINPNLHVILIHYPLGLLVVGTLIEFFSFLGWRKSAFRAAGRWMLLIGILSLTPTLFSGLYALADVNKLPATETSEGTPDDAKWHEIRQQSPIQGEAWDFMVTHAWSNAIGSTLLLITCVLWMGSSDDWRRKLHFVWLLLLIAGLGTIIYGAWFGGEMVYRHGVGVEPLRDAASETKSLASEGTGTGSVATIEQTDWKQRAGYYAPPLQVHTIVAGAAVHSRWRRWVSLSAPARKAISRAITPSKSRRCNRTSLRRSTRRSRARKIRTITSPTSTARPPSRASRAPAPPGRASGSSRHCSRSSRR